MAANCCRPAALHRAAAWQRTRACRGNAGGLQPRWLTGGSGSGTGGRAPDRLAAPLQAAAAKDELLRGVDPDNKEAVARIVEQAERAAESWTVAHSDFVTPPVAADAMMVLKRMADVAGTPWGGYPQAERCRVAVGREEALEAAAADTSQLGGVAAVQCSGNFLFDPATHRDFLGACLGTGIERGKVGDILITGEQGAQIIVAPNLVEHLESALTQVRTVPVQTRAISLSELQVRAPRVEELSSVEASLRLDAVASAGFRVSRSKMMDLIKSGDVRVNWRSGSKPSAEVKAGDVVSVAGKGRLEVKEAERTKKGKWSVKMVRYL